MSDVPRQLIGHFTEDLPS